jgi:hypothetical protein
VEFEQEAVVIRQPPMQRIVELLRCKSMHLT